MKTCKNCGRVYDDNLNFCPNCHSRQVASFVGAKSATDQEYEKIQQELNVKKEEAKKTSTNLFVFFVILFVAIALGVFYYMNTPQHKLDSEAKKTYSAAVQQAKNGEYDAAITTLNSIDTGWSNYQKVDKEKAEIVKFKLKDILPSYQSAGNYEGILSLITASVDDVSVDTELNSIYNDALTQYRGIVIAQADSLVSAGDYGGAADTLEKAAYASGSDFELVKRAALMKAQAATMNGDYVSAINLINDKIDVVGGDGDVQSALSNCQQAYKQAIIAQAYDIYNTSGYASALEVINGALTIIPDDSELLAEKDAYVACSPVDLTTLESYDDDGAITIAHGETDIFGNQYDSAICGGSVLHHEKASYYIDGQYNLITGTIYVSDSQKGNSGTNYYRIYGDDALLYSASMTSSDLPIYFTVNITGVKDLRIEMDDPTVWGLSTGFDGCIGNPMLQKTR